MGRKLEARAIREEIRNAKKRRYAEMLGNFKANKAAVIGSLIIVILTLMGVFAPLIFRESPYEFDLKKALEPPSLESPLGRDELGRDILTRIAYGAKYTLGVAVAAVALGALVGTVIGAVSGYFGGHVDSVIQRATDALLAFPTLVLAIALAAALGIGVINLILAIGISSIPVYIRLARGVTLSVKNEDFVAAARLLGKSDWYVLVKHVIPNILTPIIVQSTYYLGQTILIASGLGFLGLGVPPPAPEWGAMIGTGRTYIYSSPHVVMSPGLFILAAAISFNVIGDGLRDALDPRARALVRRFS